MHTIATVPTQARLIRLATNSSFTIQGMSATKTGFAIHFKSELGWTRKARLKNLKMSSFNSLTMWLNTSVTHKSSTIKGNFTPLSARRTMTNKALSSFTKQLIMMWKTGHLLATLTLAVLAQSTWSNAQTWSSLMANPSFSTAHKVWTRQSLTTITSTQILTRFSKNLPLKMQN